METFKIAKGAGQKVPSTIKTKIAQKQLILKLTPGKPQEVKRES